MSTGANHPYHTMKDCILILLLMKILRSEAEESNELYTPKLLSVIKEASKGKEISVDFDSSCILEVISSFVDRCEQIDEMDESEKSAVAIRLSECIFDEQFSGQMQLPKDCYKEMQTRQDVKRCVSQLAENPVWWTTYFGYLNLVADICNSYRGPLEQQHALSTYRLLEVRIEKMVGLLEQISRGGFMDELRQDMDSMVRNVADEASERMRYNVEQVAKDMVGNIHAQNREVAEAVKKASESAVKNQRDVESFNKQLRTMHQDSMEELARVLGGKQKEIEHLIDTHLGSSFQLWSKVQRKAIRAVWLALWICVSTAILGVAKFLKRTNVGSFVEIACAGMGVIVGQALYCRIVQ